MVSKETQVQTLIPTIVVFWSYVDFYMLYVDCMLTIQVLYLGCMFKNYELYYIYAPKMVTYCVDDEWKCIVECLAKMHNGNG
jgi:hypothetical protein